MLGLSSCGQAFSSCGKLGLLFICIAWASPGKDTGVDYHALLQGIFQTKGSNLCFLWLLHYRWILYPWATGEAQSESESCSVLSDSLRHRGLYSPWNSPGQHTGMGSLFFLQWIFPTQGSNPDLLHCRQILYQLSHQGSPRILEWVAYLFSSRSSWSRNRTRVSCIAGRFFTNWTSREAYC